MRAEARRLGLLVALEHARVPHQDRGQERVRVPAELPGRGRAIEREAGLRAWRRQARLAGELGAEWELVRRGSVRMRAPPAELGLVRAKRAATDSARRLHAIHGRLAGGVRGGEEEDVACDADEPPQDGVALRAAPLQSQQQVSLNGPFLAPPRLTG